MSFKNTYLQVLDKAKKIALQKGKIELMVVRKWFTTQSSIGTMYIFDDKYCYTLEDFTRIDGSKVYGKTAIPYDTYKVDITYSPKFKRKLPLIENVFNFTGIRIHPGNDPSSTLGCILVALDKGEDKIMNSKMAFDPLFQFLLWGKENNLPITIKVTNFQRELTIGGGAILVILLLITILTKYTQ